MLFPPFDSSILEPDFDLQNVEVLTKKTETTSQNKVYNIIPFNIIVDLFCNEIEIPVPLSDSKRLLSTFFHDQQHIVVSGTLFPSVLVAQQ